MKPGAVDVAHPDLESGEFDISPERLANLLSTAHLVDVDRSVMDRISDALRACAASGGAAVRVAWQQAGAHLVADLARLAATAPFLLPILAKRPDVLCGLATDDLSRPRQRADFEAALDRAFAAAPSDDEAGEILRRVKYSELIRITMREASLERVPFERTAETLLEISDLADALLNRAIEIAAARIRAAVGLPCWLGPDGNETALPFTVFGLGKLGSQELNYSSDVDLVYAYGCADRELAEAELRYCGSDEISPAAYFTRLAQEFHRLVTATTAEGFLYRIDLDLRPEGASGALVLPSVALLSYFENAAATWERAAFMKARPVAGDVEFGWRLIREMVPLLYRSTMDFEGVAAIKTLKQQVEAAKGRTGATFNVKLGPGGIRDVESVAQAMQLLHGGRIPQLRQRSTQATIEGLRDAGVLDADHATGLLAAYRFYRRAENRVQMFAERQTHVLPADAGQMHTLAQSLGFTGPDAVEQFHRELEQHRAFCRARFAEVFSDAGPDRVMGLLMRHVPQALGNPVNRPLYENLASQFGREIDAGAHPERTLVNLDRFLAGLRGRRFYFELLFDRPELIRRLASLFAASEYLSAFFAAYPRLIEPIFDDPKTLLLDRSQLDAEFESIWKEASADERRDPTEVYLESLRLFHHRAMVNIGLIDLDDKVERSAIEQAHTWVAETCIARALTLAEQQVRTRTPRPSDSSFLVVGMGKLGSCELTYGSDLDVIFLYDVAGASEYELATAQEYFARLAQKMIWALTTPVVTGTCYEVDARLRPSGGQGTLVTSLGGFRAYHERGAQVWERQALLRARGVSGDGELASRFDALRREILGRSLHEDPAPEIDRIRRRMEGEIARETAQRHDFKTGHGGLLDVESVVQLLQLRHAGTLPTLLDTSPVADQIERLAAAGFLDREAHEALSNGWNFLQRLSNRLRIVANRSISDLDEERGDLDALAHTLGYQSLQRAGGARRSLLADYQRHTSAVRAVYERYFRPN